MFAAAAARNSQNAHWLWLVYITCLIGMIVVPLPPVFLDILVASNFTLSFLLLFSTFYAKTFTQLSTFPTLILLTTVLRLAVSVATSRAVLSGYSPGAIVSAFGHFVVAGSLAVGVTIFLVVLIVQFLVVTKGAERISEVSARFTLDSLPGRQMSIEADVRSGKLTPEEANSQRAALREESQLIGALEGAMRFVKGDAIATFIIVFLNLVGGLSIAMLERGEGFADASKHFLILSIGDGVVAQLPSMLTGLAAGVLITRAGASSGDIGGKIGRELLSNHGASLCTAGVLIGMALVPGFPALVMLLLASLLLTPVALHYLGARVQGKSLAIAHQVDQAEDLGLEFLSTAHYADQFVCHIAQKTFNELHLVRFGGVLKAERKSTSRRYGFALPRLTFQVDGHLPEKTFRFTFEGAIIGEMHVSLEKPDELIQLARVFEDFVFTQHVRSMTEDDFDDWMKGVAERFPSLAVRAKEFDRSLLFGVFRRLLLERVSVAYARPILEAVLHPSNSEEPIAQYVDRARFMLRAVICQALPQGEVVELSSDHELCVRAVSVFSSGGQIERLEDFQKGEAEIGALSQEFRMFASEQKASVLIVPQAIRFNVAEVFINSLPFVPVLSVSEYVKPNIEVSNER